MVSAVVPERAEAAATAFTTEVPHQFRHGGLDVRPVTDLAWDYTDDPFIGSDGGPFELRPVVDYERVSLLHSSPLVGSLRGRVTTVPCHLCFLGLVGTR